METATKQKPKTLLSKRNGYNLKVSKTKNSKNPMNLFGIFKDKIFYESDEVLMN